MTTETLSFNTAGGPTTAFVALPDTPGEKAVIVIQEWWGLNDHIKDIASRYATEGFTAIAPDLYRGRIAKDPQEASQMMHALSIEDGVDTIKNTIDAAGISYALSHFGITGYCMGGTYALRSACELEGISACAAFYGDIPDDEILQKLTAPTIIHLRHPGSVDQPAKGRRPRGRDRTVRTAGYVGQIRRRPRLFQRHAARGLQRDRRPRCLGARHRILQRQVVTPLTAFVQHKRPEPVISSSGLIYFIAD